MPEGENARRRRVDSPGSGISDPSSGGAPDVAFILSHVWYSGQERCGGVPEPP
eukprot:CAMPEP_0182457044 /NCGR_PEP_ID=MMETSP1319-20130603/2721_1 /TAXON_ID=172717 /ORGANISM="Bolidomonas pacifica, Strain RCC208" /LENGTH=52 /DNA_ID=CAMNT_0024655429 /DNA_START=141 /DNA_END=299 /DNA_ORIENTATION=+